MRTVLIYTSTKMAAKKVASRIGADALYMYRENISSEIRVYDRVILFCFSEDPNRLSKHYLGFLDIHKEILKNASYIFAVPYGVNNSEEIFGGASGIIGRDIEFHRRLIGVPQDPIFIVPKKRDEEYAGYMAEIHKGIVVSLKDLEIEERSLYVYVFRSEWAESNFEIGYFEGK